MFLKHAIENKKRFLGVRKTKCGFDLLLDKILRQYSAKATGGSSSAAAKPYEEEIDDEYLPVCCRIAGKAHGHEFNFSPTLNYLNKEND